MKKLLLAILFFSATTNAQIVNIPDTVFKARLIALGVDNNHDGNIQLTEAQAVTSLNVSGLDAGFEMTSMTGIESFTNLIYLDCSHNRYLGNLPIDNLTSLTYLNCTRTGRNSLNVSNLINLTHLELNVNQVSVLDVAPLTHLTYLDCGGNNLSSLDVGNLTDLTFLNCGYNNLSVLNVSNLTNLVTVYCSVNQISVLDIGQLTQLEFLMCNHNQISNLNLSNLVQLRKLFCEINPITSINTGALTNLTDLLCGSPQLTGLDLTNNVNLAYLTIAGGQFENIDLSHLTNLSGLNIYYGALTSLDISHNPLLHYLYLAETTTIRYLNLKNGGTIDELDLRYASNVMNVCCNQGDLNLVTYQLSITNTASVVTISANCLFFPMGEYNTITGKVRFDLDSNGCDTNDFLQPNVKMKISSGSNVGYTYTNADGEYFFFPQTGNFTIMPVSENQPFFNFAPAPVTVNFANNNGNMATHDFCSTINGTHIDVEVIIVPITPARPGFDATYKIIYRNKGNQTVSGDIQLTYEDDILDYVSSTLTLDSQSTGVLNWTYTDLLPFETRDFTVVMNVNSPVETPAVNIGDQLDFVAVISPLAVDEFAYDNTFGLKQTVIGSFDPNDKACLEGSLVSATRIGEYLHYNINFENVGTAAAEFVRVKDVIDTAKFDLSTMTVLNSSHPMITRVEGNVVQFVFDNIDLGSNEHGNVTFKVKTRTNLTSGSSVANKANIFFDYNAPIETNTASTTFQDLGLNEHDIDKTITIYPNPARNAITINSKNEIKTVQLFDVNGRILMTKISNGLEAIVPISEYSNGVYFLKVFTEKGAKTEKIVKE